MDAGIENKYLSSNGAHQGTFSHQDSALTKENDDSEVGFLVDFCEVVNPLESQLPPCNVFSRKEMSSFFRKKKISPQTYFSYERKRLETVSRTRENDNGSIQRREISETSSESRRIEVGSSNGSLSRKNVSSSRNGSYVAIDSYGSSGPNLNGLGKCERHSLSKIHDSTITSMELDKGVVSKTIPLSGNEAVEVIEGHMCASTTGVVRVQSRKKAEMF